jgi:hypothetical protein
LTLLLPIACAALLATIGVQDYLVPALRQQSISSGLTGPYDGWLLAAFAFLSTALVLAFRHTAPAAQALADAAAFFLVLTGASGRFTKQIPNGETWHTRLTAVTFALAIALQFVCNGHDPKLWVITFGSVLYALTTRFLVPVASVTEKVGVTGLCLWLIGWSL